MNTLFTPAHLLKALMHKEAGLQDLLKRLDKDIYYLEEWADVRIESVQKSSSVRDLVTGDPLVGEVMNEADNIRLKLMKDHIEPLHLLAAVSTPGVGFTYDQVKTLTLRRDELIQSVTEAEELRTVLGQVSPPLQPGAEKGGSTAALLKYCVDKTLQAKEDKTDVIVGRDKEVRMMAEIICRRSKPNVLLAGDPGVGKSALVDGFARAIIEQKVPQHLANARIFELNTGALIAGASY
jgi:ATP-dependent Clp protease ATP-binding subunit ClpA